MSSRRPRAGAPQTGGRVESELRRILLRRVRRDLQNEATIVVGGADTAYVFAEPGGGWAASAQQTETRALKGEGETSHLAETSVATGAEGKTIVLGVPGQIVNEHTEKAAVNQGAVFIYSEPSGGWKEAPAAPARITTADGKTQDEFGTAVAISASESTIAAGAPYTFEGESRTTETGRAYILTRPADGWTDLASIGVVEFKPKSSMFTEGAHFGSAAAISETGATVAIGAPGYSFNEGAGTSSSSPAGAGSRDRRSARPSSPAGARSRSRPMANVSSPETRTTARKAGHTMGGCSSTASLREDGRAVSPSARKPPTRPVRAKPDT